MSRGSRHAHADEFPEPAPKDEGTAGLGLFDAAAAGVSAGQRDGAAAPEQTIDAAFAGFHATNPHVYAELEARALQLHAAGRTRVGIKALVEGLRFDMALRTGADDFKINNDYTSRYARRLVAAHPRLAAVIELRQLRPKGDA